MISNTIQVVDETNKGCDLKIIDLCNEFYTGENLSVLANKKILIKVSVNYEKDVFDNSSIEQQENMTLMGLPYHAMTIIPSDLDYSKFIIFLRESVFTDYQHYSTLYHEFTHTIDFINYFNDYGNVYIKDEVSKQLCYYYEFYFWTEYNAKKRGLQRFYYEIEKYNYEINLVDSTSNFLSSLQSRNTQFINLYHLVHFFARLSLFETKGLFSFSSAIFPKKVILETFGSSSIALYDLFKEMDDYTSFKGNLLEITRLISDILE